MSLSKTLRQVIQSVGNTLAQIGTYLGAGVKRIFAPSDDQYPNTGVQPFEGDIDDKKKHPKAW
jgi:hypothetical protein